jgi:hypothetical protein
MDRLQRLLELRQGERRITSGHDARGNWNGNDVEYFGLQFETDEMIGVIIESMNSFSYSWMIFLSGVSFQSSRALLCGNVLGNLFNPCELQLNSFWIQ